MSTTTDEKNQDIKRKKYAYTPVNRQIDHGRGYTSFIRFLRIGLPILAGIIILFLVVRLTMGDKETSSLKANRAEQGETKGQTSMVQAKYEGLDALGRAYRVTAEEVSKSLINPDVMNLKNPMADMMLVEGNWIAVSADEGVYNEKESHLTLKGNVKLFHDTGHEFSLDDLVVDLKDNTAWSKSIVSGQGPMGQVSAKNIEIKDGGKVFIFRGPAKMVLHQGIENKDKE